MSGSKFVGEVRKGRRLLNSTEIYSKLHYAERIQPAVAERLKTLASSNVSVSAAERLEIIKKITRDLYDDESEEIKREVSVKMEEFRKASLAEPTEEETVRTPQDYQK